MAQAGCVSGRRGSSFEMGVPVSRKLLPSFWLDKQLKIASFLAMTTILMAQGRNKGRQRKDSCHCEEKRRGNLPYFFLRLVAYTQFF